MAIHHGYWVDQHRLLAGEYPRNRDKALSSAKLDAAPEHIIHWQETP